MVKEILGSEKIDGLKIENVLTGEQTTVPSEGVFVFIGHDPNSQMLNGQIELHPDGTVKIDDI